jgi:amino acid transporter
MTLIELRDFVKWFARDTVRMASNFAVAVFYIVFRLPIEFAQDHVEAFEHDQADGWAKLVVISVLSYLLALLATAITFVIIEAPREQFISAIGTVSWVFGAVVTVYSLTVLVTYKVRQFRRERQRMLDTLKDN